MTEVPYLNVTETQEGQFPMIRAGGSDVICVIGKSQLAKADLTDPDSIMEYWNPWDAAKTVENGGIGPQTDQNENELLTAIEDIFEEGSQFKPGDTPTISKVYAINVGATPTEADWEDAAALIEIKKDIDIELYQGCFDTNVMTSTETRLDTLVGSGDYRLAGFITDPADTTATLAADITTGLTSTRVWVKWGGLQAKFAAKIACTPYWKDPSREAYRSVKESEVEALSLADQEILLQAGICFDQETPTLDADLVDSVTPVRAISVGHQLVDGTRPLDSNLHTRRNVDYQWHMTDMIAYREIKNNDTATLRTQLISAIGGHFVKQAALGYIVGQKQFPQDEGWAVEVYPSESDPYTLNIIRRIRPVNAIYFIEIQSVIHSPAAEIITPTREGD